MEDLLVGPLSFFSRSCVLFVMLDHCNFCRVEMMILPVTLAMERATLLNQLARLPSRMETSPHNGETKIGEILFLLANVWCFLCKVV